MYEPHFCSRLAAKGRAFENFTGDKREEGEDQSAQAVVEVEAYWADGEGKSGGRGEGGGLGRLKGAQRRKDSGKR